MSFISNGNEVSVTGGKADVSGISGEISLQGYQYGAGIPDSALTEYMIAWYRFEDGDGRDYASSNRHPNTTWGDGTEYDGTVNSATYDSSGGVTDWENGSPSGAFDFTYESGEDIELPTAIRDNYINTNTHTKMAWVYSTNTGEQYILGDGTRNNSLTYNGGLGGTIYNGSSRDTVVTSINQNQWYHLAMTYDASTDDFEVFVDGSSIGSSNNGTPQSGDNPPNIGNDNDTSRSFGGTLDDVRVYDTVLTQTQINDIYQETQP